MAADTSGSVERNMTSQASRRSAVSEHAVLPPIISNEKDRDFMYALTNYITTELRTVDGNDSKQRYITHKDAFDKVIEYVTSYKPLLTAIKAEYEDCIGAVERGQQESFYLTGKINALATEPGTIHNYRKRADDLDYKLDIIAEDNERLRHELNQLRTARLEKERKQQEQDTPKKKVIKRDCRHIPGLSLQQATDVKVLMKELEKVDKQLKDLNISYKTRYSSVDIRDTLKEHLSQKVVLRDQLQEQTAILKQKRHKLKIAVEAANAYIKIQPPHQTIGEAVINALNRASTASQGADKGFADDLLQQKMPSSSFEDDDPSKEKEAELMLEYIEKFNELLEDGRLEEAATHAANSPKGILRTPETLHRFMDLRDRVTSLGRSPYLAFCDWLMATVPAYPSRPSDYLSLECVKCALEENHLDLITHWLSQDRLTLTQLMGDMIIDFSHVRPHLLRQCMSLAQKIYSSVHAHVPAVICMVKQQRLRQALEYAQKFRMSCVECTAVLSSQPSAELAQCLYSAITTNQRLLPMGRVAHTLIESGCDDLAVNFLLDSIQKNTASEDQTTTLLRGGVFEDEVTTQDQWLHIVDVCQQHGETDVALQLLASATVINSVRKATKQVEEIERLKLEEKRKQEEEIQKQQEAKKKEKRRRRRRIARSPDTMPDSDN